jgi:hypothetical protein
LIPYIFVSFILFLIILIPNNSRDGKHDARLIKFGLAFLTLLIFLGFRYETGGPDWISYKSFYTEIEPIDEVISHYDGSFFQEHNFEFLFKLIGSTFKFFTDDYIIFLAGCEFFILLGVFHFFKKYSSYPFLSIFIYFSSVSLLGDMTVVRQMIAMSITLFSYKYILKRNFLKFLGIIFFATLFHYSALIMVLFYLSVNYLSKLKYILISFAIALFIKLKLSMLIDLMINYFMFGGDLGAGTQFKINDYLVMMDDGSAGIGIGFLERLMLLGLLFFLRNRFEGEHDKLNLVIALLSFNIFLSLLFFDIPVFYLRFRYYFVIGNCLAYSIILYHLKEKAIFLFLMLFYGIFWISTVTLSNRILYLPYQNYFEVLILGDKVQRSKHI